MIYCVEDERNIRELIVYTLESSGFTAKGLESGKELNAAIAEQLPDLILLDIMLPGEDGLEILSRLKASEVTKEIPVIMVTAKGAEYDKVMGLDCGADDYITKPFNPLELIARVKSAYRRYTKYNEKNEENIIYINGLEIDQDKHICKLYDKQIELTPMEFDILLYLAQKRGNVVSSEELFEKVWKEKYLENNNTVMVHIRRIREKLNEDTKKTKFIKTVWGVGYKIEK